MNPDNIISLESHKLNKCVHCGLCLDICPTYKISGNESNSPRGRLAQWRALSEKRIKPSEQTDFYLEECLGCLACESVCPSNVSYGKIFHLAKSEKVLRTGQIAPVLTFSSLMTKYPWFRQFIGLPIRALRKSGLLKHKFFFPGNPSLFMSTADYAYKLNEMFKPSGPKVALFTGCIMDSFFREINFASIRVLTANNVQVVIPSNQVCCGAVLEHGGLPGKEKLDRKNNQVFDSALFDKVLVNSAGCGLSLSSSLKKEVQDLTVFLNTMEIIKGSKLHTDKIFVDIPCHLYHGQKIHSPFHKILNAVGNDWALIPEFEECCGSGGVYNMTHPKNAQKIIKERSDFLKEVPEKKCILATSNHVCMMQWYATVGNIREKDVVVRHVIQLLDESYEKSGIYKSFGLA